jgi:hypothetical protein
VYRGDRSGATTLLATVSTITTWTDPTASSGGRFYYVVTAVNTIGEGPASNEASAVAR